MQGSYTAPNDSDRKRAKKLPRGFYSEPNDEKDDTDERTLGNTSVHQERRHMISLAYLHVLGAPPASKWKDTDDEPGTISTLQTMLQLSSDERKIIQRVLVATNTCLKAGIVYNGEILWERGHPTRLIEENSTEETIIANYIERGCSVSLTTIVLNVHRYRKNLPPIGRSAVYNASKRMVSRVAPVVKRCQGNVDKESNWAKANKAQKGQLLLRAGFPVDLDCYKGDDGNLPKGFDMEHMTPVYKEGLVYFDEAHQYCRTTELGNLDTTNVQFPRDANGNYDPNGTYALPAQLCTHKYEKQVRKCYGVCIVNGVGVRVAPFDYSDKLLVTEETMEHERWKAIRNIKNNPKSRNNKDWNTHPRVEGAYYESDPITKVNGIGKAKADQLIALNIKTVDDLRKLEGSVALINNILNNTNGIGIGSINKWINDAKTNTIDGDAPVGICYLDSENPYAAKHGEDNWKDVIDGSSAMSGFVSIRKLVKHMVDVSMAVYAGTTMEGKWFFYHDALKQLTAADTIRWMEEQDYLKWWLRPEHGVCSAYGRFKVHYVGNQAEAMPLDNSLFAEVLQALDRMVVLSHALCDDKDDPRMFSMTTPIK